MNEIFFIAALAFGIWIYRTSKIKKYPNRLHEVEQALKIQADLWLYRNKDVQASGEFRQLAIDLKTAQSLLNEGAESVRAHWWCIRPQIFQLTSEEGLKKIDFFYSDRREEVKAALYDLVARLDKVAGQA